MLFIWFGGMRGGRVGWEVVWWCLVLGRRGGCIVRYSLFCAIPSGGPVGKEFQRDAQMDHWELVMIRGFDVLFRSL